MRSFKGTTTGNVQSEVFTKDTEIKYFIVTNKSSGTVVVNVRVQDESAHLVHISPKDLHLAHGESFRGFGLVLLNLERVILSVTGGEVDYYFSIFDSEQP